MSSHAALTILQPAWLLHRRPYRETSLLIEAFTASAGRIALIAKGARGGRKGLALRQSGKRSLDKGIRAISHEGRELQVLA